MLVLLADFLQSFCHIALSTDALRLIVTSAGDRCSQREALLKFNKYAVRSDDGIHELLERKILAAFPGETGEAIFTNVTILAPTPGLDNDVWNEFYSAECWRVMNSYDVPTPAAATPVVEPSPVPSHQQQSMNYGQSGLTMSKRAYCDGCVIS